MILLLSSNCVHCKPVFLNFPCGRKIFDAGLTYSFHIWKSKVVARNRTCDDRRKRRVVGDRNYMTKYVVWCVKNHSTVEFCNFRSNRRLEYSLLCPVMDHNQTNISFVLIYFSSTFYLTFWDFYMFLSLSKGFFGLDSATKISFQFGFRTCTNHQILNVTATKSSFGLVINQFADKSLK